MLYSIRHMPLCHNSKTRAHEVNICVDCNHVVREQAAGMQDGSGVWLCTINVVVQRHNGVSWVVHVVHGGMGAVLVVLVLSHCHVVLGPGGGCSITHLRVQYK